MKYIYKLSNTIQNYSWGTKDFIAQLQGKNVSDIPQAELWMGAHPKASSKIILDAEELDLHKVITKQKDWFIGDAVSIDFSSRLPFLMKVLSAESALSLQVHPNKTQSEIGFRRENELSVPLFAFNRNYKDDNHKLELLCALTEFDVMCGFQPISEICERLEYFGILEDQSAELKNNPNPESFEMFFWSLLDLSLLEQIDLVKNVISKLESPRNSYEKYLIDWIKRLEAKYPGDIGVLAPLWLNVFRLLPGEAVYLEAGLMHAYLQGSGIEIMANSDNVLRGGLTSKHIDLVELKNTILFKNGFIELAKVKLDQNEITYLTPANEFELSTIEVHSEVKRTKDNKPEIILCTNGNVSIIADEKLDLSAGESLFVCAACESYQITGEGTVFRAKVPNRLK